MRGLLFACMAIGTLFQAALITSAKQPNSPDVENKTLQTWLATLTAKDLDIRREQARELLGPDGPYAKLAIPLLIEALKGGPGHYPANSSVILADYGPAAVPRLIQALKRSEVEIRLGAAKALCDSRPIAKAALPALIEATHDASPAVRAKAAAGISRVGRSASETVPALIAALDDKEEAVRLAAAHALVEIGPKSAPAVSALIRALEDKYEEVQTTAAKALGKIGPEAKAAVPALVKALRSKQKEMVGIDFAQALGLIGPDSMEAVPVLIEILEDKDRFLREKAAWALGAIGPGAKPAVPSLVAMAETRDEQGRRFAIEALGRIGPEAKVAVPLLMKALAAHAASDTHDLVTPARALGGIGPAAKPAVPALAAIVRDREPWNGLQRKTAAEALFKIDPEFAIKGGMESALLDVKLGQIPKLELAPRDSVTEAQSEQIKALIAQLASIKRPDFGMSATLTGHAFAPLPSRKEWGTMLLTDHNTHTSDSFQELVHLGPAALPFLLDALGDDRPTKLRGWATYYGGELEINPTNQLEKRTHFEDDDALWSRLDTDHAVPGNTYTVKVGDVCFVAIGQIVGRRYSAVRYQPTRIVIVNSPVEDEELRKQVRAIWSSKDPTKKLFDSLLLDFATEGIFNGKSLDGWHQGNSLQIESALRLLYYFPKEAVPLIVARLNALDVKDPGPDAGASMKRDVADGVRAGDFVKAVIWCKDDRIQKALAGIFRRTDDIHIMSEMLPALELSEGKTFNVRVQARLQELPESEDTPYGTGHFLLTTLIDRLGEKAKPAVEDYLKKTSLQRSWTVCDVLMETDSAWGKYLLIPMLADKTRGNFSESAYMRQKDYGFSGQRILLRLCDRAAYALTRLDPELPLEYSGREEDMDRQITAMREKLAGKK